MIPLGCWLSYLIVCSNLQWMSMSLHCSTLKLLTINLVNIGVIFTNLWGSLSHPNCWTYILFFNTIIEQTSVKLTAILLIFIRPRRTQRAQRSLRPGMQSKPCVREKNLRRRRFRSLSIKSCQSAQPPAKLKRRRIGWKRNSNPCRYIDWEYQRAMCVDRSRSSLQINTTRYMSIIYQ